MMSISKATEDYFKREFEKSQERYLSKDAASDVNRKVSGRLGEFFDLRGEITREQFERLAKGQHPTSGRQLIRASSQSEYVNENGEKVKPAEHRAGWDLTLSAPKSVSEAALVGGDKGLLEDHREAVKLVLEEVEKFVGAKQGGNKAAARTGNGVFVSFEHDAARPVDGYAAPQLHTHNFLMNMTLDGGKVRALETEEIYKTQHYFTTLYRAELARRVMKRGYEIEVKQSGAFELKGFSEEFLKANSPRSVQRDETLRERGLEYSARAGEVAILDKRERKADMTEAEIRRQWHEVDEKFGRQTERVVELARERERLGEGIGIERRESARDALTFALEHITERKSVFEETEVLATALKVGMGELKPELVKKELVDAVERGEVLIRRGRDATPAARLTTSEVVRMEEKNIETVHQGQGDRGEIARTPLIDSVMKAVEKRKGIAFNKEQREAIEEILSSRDQVQGLQGAAGVGKTTVLEAIREVAEADGYTVKGFAPTAKAARILSDSGIESNTIQSFTAAMKGVEGGKRLYVVDEASLLSTKEVRKFFERLRQEDRVLLTGDARQHLAVERGDPFSQLQKNGLATARIEQIVRQRNPELRAAIQDLAKGNAVRGLKKLETLEYQRPDGTRQGVFHQEKDRESRLRVMARDFAADPEKTLAVAPDNRTRRELNEQIREELKGLGILSRKETAVTILVNRDMTQAQRRRVFNYEVGDTLRFGGRTRIFEGGEYVRVMETDVKRNRLTVERRNGERVIYNPGAYSNVEVFQSEKRALSEGDRIQFTSRDNLKGIANRQLGRISRVTEEGVEIKTGKGSVLMQKDRLHLDHGYATTSHSSQGETINRVLVHAEGGQSRSLLNDRFTYVANSRAVLEARIYTNDMQAVLKDMARTFGKQNALNTSPDGSRRLLSEDGMRRDATVAQRPGVRSKIEQLVGQVAKAIDSGMGRVGMKR